MDANYLTPAGIDSNRVLGSTLDDYMNYIRKLNIYKGYIGTNNDFKIIGKVEHCGLFYEQIYAVLDYKRKGNKFQDEPTFTEVVDYNDTITSLPGPTSPQVLKKHVFFLAIILDTMGVGRDKLDQWHIDEITILKYLRGNPRPELSGLEPCIVMHKTENEENGKEVRQTKTGVRVDLIQLEKGLTFEQYMAWELEYRRTRYNEALKILQERDYLAGRSWSTG